jgi:hypothetical protein
VDALVSQAASFFVDGYDEIGVGQSEWGVLIGEPVVAGEVVEGLVVLKNWKEASSCRLSSGLE